MIAKEQAVNRVGAGHAKEVVEVKWKRLLKSVDMIQAA